MRTVRQQICGFAITMATVLAPAFVAGTAAAQESAPHRIAVVDVGFIFKNHKGIQGQLKGVEANLKAYDTELKQKRETLKSTAAKLKTLSPGSPEYTQLEEQFAGMESKLRLDMVRKRKELADAEAKIYYDSYQHVTAGVKFLANHYKINLVLRYNSEDMKEANGESVIRGVMKNIVYHDKELDMTAGVMQYLDTKVPAVAVNTPPTPRR